MSQVAIDSFAPPDLVFKGRVWPSTELVAMASHGADAVRQAAPPGCRRIALVMTNDPEAVALFFGVSALTTSLILLPSDPRAWACSPPLPADTLLILTPGTRHLAPDGERMGLRVRILTGADLAPRPASAMPSFLSCRAIVGFSSGSTGMPKPVCRTPSGLIRETTAIAQALGLAHGDGILSALPLDGFHGLPNGLLLAAVLGGRLGLLERFDHRSLFALTAADPYRYLALTSFMADILARCPLEGGRPRMPEMLKVSGAPLPERVFRAFAARFGAVLRPAYGASEHGIISADVAPPDRVRPDAVGQAVPGIEIRIGDEPTEPFPPGEPGPIWVRNPWYMDGYGFPPQIERPAGRGRWQPTEDVGVLGTDGYLTLRGRRDECFKTAAGKLASPAQITVALGSHPAVVDGVVLPLAGPAGNEIGVIVECADRLHPSELRAHIARRLPSWSHPRRLLVVDQLPRLPGGKVDRRACQALLDAR